MSYTPGPWRIYTRDRANGDYAIWVGEGFSEADALIADVSGGLGRVDEGDGDPFCHQSAANAKLIAAAPELLEALESCLAYVKKYYKTLPDDGVEQDFLMGAVIYPAEEAIAKAKGE